MEISHALSALNALSQETRLLIFKKLVEFGTSGVNAGELARELNVPTNTLSFHLAQLENAGLVKSTRFGRNINYCFNRAQMNELIGFLNENCCVREENIECISQSKIC
ncbi:MAG: winged helix-turn-helix transcriptional regulator [Caulobacterales bacterium]|nr:winged helix-turn-helix transcriptional regulator [Caulobacterales bacterium]